MPTHNLFSTFHAVLIGVPCVGAMSLGPCCFGNSLGRTVWFRFTEKRNIRILENTTFAGLFLVLLQSSFLSIPPPTNLRKPLRYLTFYTCPKNRRPSLLSHAVRRTEEVLSLLLFLLPLSQGSALHPFSFSPLPSSSSSRSSTLSLLSSSSLSLGAPGRKTKQGQSSSLLPFPLFFLLHSSISFREPEIAKHLLWHGE